MVVYIASPYSIGDKEFNVHRQIVIADRLMDKGHAPIVPLLNHYANKLMPRPEDCWVAADLQLVAKADIVLRLDGESKGADNEVGMALLMNIKVVYCIDDIPHSE